MLTDDQAKTAIAKNVSRILEEQDRSVYWLMKELGVGQGTIYPIVSGAVVPSVGIAARIAEILGVTVDRLLDSKK